MRDFKTDGGSAIYRKAADRAPARTKGSPYVTGTGTIKKAAKEPVVENRMEDSEIKRQVDALLKQLGDLEDYAGIRGRMEEVKSILKKLAGFYKTSPRARSLLVGLSTNPSHPLHGAVNKILKDSDPSRVSSPLTYNDETLVRVLKQLKGDFSRGDVHQAQKRYHRVVKDKDFDPISLDLKAAFLIDAGLVFYDYGILKRQRKSGRGPRRPPRPTATSI